MRAILWVSFWFEFIALPILSVLAFDLGGGWLFLIGFFVWTFLEYALHRFAHWTAFKEHARHHRYPRDESPASILLPVAILLVLPRELWSGVLFGYWLFIVLHWNIHHNPEYLPRGLVQRHQKHHMGSRRCYGVTTRFWDWLFHSGVKR